jgi:DNA-binding NarL/FixJ family response regulator
MMTLDGVPNAPLLTARQEQILQLIGDGLTNREIGDRLGVAEKTIKNSVTGLLACLNMQRRSQAAVYATVRALASDEPRTQPRIR